MSRTFTHAMTYTVGLMAFGVNGATDHFASRAEIRTALRDAEDGNGWASCGGMTVHEDELLALLSTLGSDAE
jgi:hypothetical protein